MSLLPMRLLLPSFASFSLLVPRKGWEHGEVLSFTLEFTRFSFYFPKGGAWSRFFLGAVCCPWFSGTSQRWGYLVSPQEGGKERDPSLSGECLALGSFASELGPQSPAPPHSLSHSVSRVPTSMMFSCSTLEATLNSGPLWWYRPSATQKSH